MNPMPGASLRKPGRYAGGVWFDEQAGVPDWRPAVARLRNDPVLAEIIERVGPCTLSPRPDPFLTLVGSVFSQQLSTKGALTLLTRFREQFPRKKLTPAKVRDALTGGLDDETVKWCGLSRQKRAYLIDLSEHLIDKRLDLKSLPKLDDAAVIDRLTDVKGVGVWTAQMYLMFTLCRPDVLPVLDLGIQESARRHYGLAERPKAAELTGLAEPWRPWRTVACWYLWRAKDG